MNRLIFLTIFIAVLVRVFPHAPNFAPIGAMALFGGAYLNRKYSTLIVLGTLLISDYLLLYIHPFSPNLINLSKFYSPIYLFHSTTLFVYGSFVLISLLGAWLSSRKSIRNVIFASFLSSVLFFLVTNFGVWMVGAYSRDISGLLQSYIMGIPFFRNTLLSDLFYTGAFFASYEMVRVLVFKKTPAAKI